MDSARHEEVARDMPVAIRSAKSSSSSEEGFAFGIAFGDALPGSGVFEAGGVVRGLVGLAFGLGVRWRGIPSLVCGRSS